MISKARIIAQNRCTNSIWISVTILSERKKITFIYSCTQIPLLSLETPKMWVYSTLSGGHRVWFSFCSFEVVDQRYGYNISWSQVLLFGILDIMMDHRGRSAQLWQKVIKSKHTSSPLFEIEVLLRQCLIAGYLV